MSWRSDSHVMVKFVPIVRFIGIFVNEPVVVAIGTDKTAEAKKAVAVANNFIMAAVL